MNINNISMNYMTSENPKKFNELELLYLFMNKYKTKNRYTHSFKREPYGNYNIPDDSRDKFMTLYTNAVVAGYNLSIAEKHSEFGPIVIELKFIQNDNNKEHYTESTLKKIISMYNKIIHKYLWISNTSLEVYVFEIDNLIPKMKVFENVIRIMYPYVCTKPCLQLLLRNEFMEKLKESNILNNIPFTNSIDEIFNENVIYRYDWLLYGSSYNKTKFNLKHIYSTSYNKIYETLLPEECCNKKSIHFFVNLLSVHKKEEYCALLNDNIHPADLDVMINELNNSDNPSSKKNTSDNTALPDSNALPNLLDSIPQGVTATNVKYLFGTGKSDYSMVELKKLIQNGCIDEAKTYVRQFFIKVANPPGILFWKHYDKTMIHYKIEDIKNYFIAPISNGNFEVQTWFLFDEITIYFRDMNITKGRLYQIGNQMCVNSFHGFLHKIQKKFHDYPKDIQKKVELLWNHINIVWCSNEKELFDYNKNWICHMVSGRKMTTCLYLKSGQGTGKSAITEFLQSKVLGYNIVYVTSNPDCLFNFNHQIYGKILLIFEELPSMSKNQWCVIGNALKHFVTGKTYTHKEKMKTDFETPNHLSIILCTNSNAIKIETDDRRMVVNDISHDKVGDYKYFDKIFEATNSDIVGEAFYFYCLEHANLNKNFKEYPVPFSETKKDLIVENMHSLLIYIKERHVKQQEDIDMTFSDFYDNYVQYLTENKINIISKIAVSKILFNYKLGLIDGNGNVRYVKIKAIELYNIYNSKKWIHNIDDIHHLYDEL